MSAATRLDPVDLAEDGVEQIDPGRGRRVGAVHRRRDPGAADPGLTAEVVGGRAQVPDGADLVIDEGQRAEGGEERTGLGPVVGSGEVVGGAVECPLQPDVPDGVEIEVIERVPPGVEIAADPDQVDDGSRHHDDGDGHEHEQAASQGATYHAIVGPLALVVARGASVRGAAVPHGGRRRRDRSGHRLHRATTAHRYR